MHGFPFILRLVVVLVLLDTVSVLVVLVVVSVVVAIDCAVDDSCSSIDESGFISGIGALTVARAN
jgi:hypothetical protein